MKTEERLERAERWIQHLLDARYTGGRPRDYWGPVPTDLPWPEGWPPRAEPPLEDMSEHPKATAYRGVPMPSRGALPKAPMAAWKDGVDAARHWPSPGELAAVLKRSAERHGRKDHLAHARDVIRYMTAPVPPPKGP